MARFRRFGRLALALSFATLAAPIAALTSSHPVAAQETMRIIAVVNDEVISQVDLAARIDFQLVAAGQTPSNDARRKLAAQTLRALVDEKLQLQEAADKKITISDDEVAQNIADIEAQNKMTPGAIFEMLDGYRIPHETLLNQIKARLAWQRTVLRKLRLATSIGDDDIDEALAELRKSIGKPESLVSEIFLAVDTPDAEPDVLKTAQKIIAQARGGGNFASLARQYSDSAAAAVDGDLGWVREHQLDGPLDEALQTMRKDQISEPIRTTRGFYILKLRDRRTTEAADPAQAQVKLSQITLPLDPRANAAEIKSQNELARMIADSVAGCPDLDQAGKEVGSGAAAGSTVRLGEVDADLRDAVMKLPIGKASEPIRTAKGFTVVMVCQRIANDGLPSRESVRQNLMLQRLDAQSRRYLRDLREAAFIDIRAN
jgi:peptidyl-prolyl cis-trans isomerase SurA